MRGTQIPPDRDLPREIQGFLEEKVRTLQEYLSITQGLQERIPKNDLEGMKTLLGQREKLTQRVDRINADLERCQALLSPGRGAPGTGFPESCTSLRKTVKGLLERTAVLESDCVGQILGLRKQIRKEIGEKRGGLKVMHTYARPALFAPRFMDTKQ